jgi:TusA-related sulfurtransferase
MSDIVVDARGQPCPQPLIITKQALKDKIVGTVITVLVDNETSCQNVERFLRDNGLLPQVSREGGEFAVRFTKNAPELTAPDTACCCCAPAGSASPDG